MERAIITGGTVNILRSLVTQQLASANQSPDDPISHVEGVPLVAGCSLIK